MSSFRSMVIAGLAAATLAPPALAGVKEGIDAWVRGDYAAAAAEWRKYAVKGDPDAQFNLGQAYKYGRGVPADLKIAQSWFQKAAVQGHAGAQANLGLLLFQNGDRPAAMPWLAKAAERSDPRAQYIVGTAAFNGDLAPRDWPRAYALMTRAAAAGLPQAATSIAMMNSYIPAEQRQQGVALAAEMEQRDAAAQTRQPVPEPASSPPITTVELPPSELASVADMTAGWKHAPVKAVKKPVAATKPTAPAQPVTAKSAAAKPATAPAVAAASAKTSSPAGGWRIQLGAFAKPGAAEKLWAGLSGRAGLRGAQSFIAKTGATNRLQAGPFAGKAAASSACRAATAAGTACFVVAP